MKWEWTIWIYEIGAHSALAGSHHGKSTKQAFLQTFLLHKIFSYQDVFQRPRHEFRRGSNVELFKCSNVQMFKCWTGQQICWLVKVLNTDLTAARAVFSITEWDETFLLKGFSFHHHFCSQTLFMMQKISEPGERHDPWVNREPSSEKYVARTDSRQAKGMRGGWGWLFRMTFSKA